MDRYQAIRNTHPTVVTINGDAEAWDNDGNVVELDESLIKTEFDKLQADYDAKEYQRTRAKSFPRLEEQLDMQYWDSVNGTTKWRDAVALVKSENPK